MTLARVLALLPLLVLAALAGVFAFRVTDGQDRQAVPSALIGTMVPQSTLPPLLGDLPGVDPATFRGMATVFNVWASWCGPCRVEHPQLMALAQDDRIQMVGLNYKDKEAAGRAFLGELGNPFDAVGVDPTGAKSHDWGIYGAPETFVVGPDGTIRAKHVGVLTPAVLSGPFGEAIEAVVAEVAASGSEGS